MEFPRQEYWSGLPFPPPGCLPNPGIEPESRVSPMLAGRFFTTEVPGTHLSKGKYGISISGSLRLSQTGSCYLHLVSWHVWILITQRLSTASLQPWCKPHHLNQPIHLPDDSKERPLLVSCEREESSIQAPPEFLILRLVIYRTCFVCLLL